MAVFDSTDLYARGKGLDQEYKLRDAKILCASCSYGLVFRRHETTGSLTTICRRVSMQVPPDIVECTGYERANVMTLSDMHDIAAVVDAREGIREGSYR